MLVDSFTLSLKQGLTFNAEEVGNLSAALLFELFESPFAAKACSCFCQSSFSSFSSDAGDKTPESFFGVSENGTLRDLFTIYDWFT